MQPCRIEIQLETQRLDLWRGKRRIFCAPISTSALGKGFEPGSHQTPTGRFVIAEKIGGGEPSGMVFRNRLPTGEFADPASPDDQITSRILWLDGAEEQNANTKSRYIYLHGTNQEATLGTPCSHGCIRLGNSDVIRLFDLVEDGTPVSIA